MAPNQLHAFSRAIGGIEEAIKTLQKSQDSESIEAKQHRDSLRNVIDALTEAMRALTGEVGNLKRDIQDVGKDVHEMRPSVDDYERDRAEARGRAKLGRWLVAVWMTISGAVVALLTWALSHWKGLGIVLLALMLATAALAHSWYSEQCCGDRDCKRVPCDQLVEDRGGWLYIPTGNRFDNLQVKPSQDRYCHVCIGTHDKRSLCAFILSGA